MNLLHSVTEKKWTSIWKVTALVMVITLATSLGCQKKDDKKKSSTDPNASKNQQATDPEKKTPEDQKVTPEKTTPKTEEPKTEEPKTEEPKTEEPKTEEPKTEEPTKEEDTTKTFGEDAAFLKKYNKDTIVLTGQDGKAAVVVVPEYQGRVMTSTATGDSGTSYGWINYKHIASQKNALHMNAFGGEERFWLGPEGGQFSIFFKPGAKFTMNEWQTPAAIDSEPYKVVETGLKNRAEFTYETKLTNYWKTEFELKVDRAVEVLTAEQASKSLGVEIPSNADNLAFVGYRTTNKLTNTGKEAWDKESGLLSIWLLGMYKPGPETTVVIPFNKGDEAELGQIVNDNYFVKVPAERLKVEEEALYFSADGKMRTKIGLNPKRAKSVCGSYDPTTKTLTIVKYNKPGPEVVDYVNSMWKIQDEPFEGDVVNSYNDGLNDQGTVMGPFYEIETSSPALALKPGETGTHISETYHFQGDTTQLDPIAKKVFGVSIEQIQKSLK